MPGDPQQRRFALGAGTAVVTGVVLRLWIVLVARPTCPRINVSGQSGCFNVGGDSVFGYWQGRLLAAGHGYIDPVSWYLDGRKVRPSAGKPPLYPAALALLDRIGIDSANGQRIVLALIGSVTIWVVAVLARRLGGERGVRVGVIAAWLAALTPALWINDTMFQVEPLSTLVMALVLLVAYRFWSAPSLPDAFALAALLGVGAMLRAEMQFMVPAVLWPVVALAATWSWRRRLGVAAAGTLVAVALWAPWLIYNQGRFAAASPWAMTTGSGAVLVSAYCDETFYGDAIGYWAAHCFEQPLATRLRPGESLTEAVDRVTGDRETTRLLTEAGRVQARGTTVTVDVTRDVLDESQYYAVTAHTAVLYAEGHLTRLPVVVVARLGWTFGVFRPFHAAWIDGTVEGRGKASAIASLFVWWASAALAIWGGVLLRRRKVTLVPILGVVAVVAGTTAVSFGVMRYRVPVDLCAILLAAVALDHAWHLRRRPPLPEAPV